MSNVKGLSLKKNFSWNLIGSLVYAFSQWIVLVLIAKLGNPEMVGIYSLGLAITAPIMMLTNLQLRAVQATDTTNEYSINEYYGLRIVTSFLSIVFSLIVIFINGYSIYKSFVIFLILISKVLDSYSDILYGYLQQRERMDYIGKSRIIKGIVTFLVMWIALLTTNDLITSLIILNGSWLLIFIVYDRKSVKLFIENITPKFNITTQKKLAIFALPLGIVVMLGSLNTNIPRIIIEEYLGEVKLGYFAAIAYLMVTGGILVNSLGQAVAPRLAMLFNNNMHRELKSLLFRVVLAGLSIGIMGTFGSIFFGEIVLKIIYDNSYSNYNDIFILVMIAAIFDYSGSFLGYGLTAMRIFKVQPYLGSIGVLSSLIFALILIPLIELRGAAYTMILVSVIQFTLKLLVLLATLKKHRLSN
ncbi:lipopolysaccharide biosynthesis protein [Aeromicrobium ponti]|nr:oligosaccharide flippase family protein [Cytobacillus oceanisediminis]